MVHWRPSTSLKCAFCVPVPYNSNTRVRLGEQRTWYTSTKLCYKYAYVQQGRLVKHCHYHSHWRCRTHDLLAQNGMVVDPKAHPLWPPHLNRSSYWRPVTSRGPVTINLSWRPLFSTLNPYMGQLPRKRKVAIYIKSYKNASRLNR